MSDPTETTAPGVQRSVTIPDDLWEAVRRAAATETLRTGQEVSLSEIVRQGARQRVRSILGEEAAP